MNRYDPRARPDRHPGEYYFDGGEPSGQPARSRASQNRRRGFEDFGYEDFGDRLRDEQRYGASPTYDGYGGYVGPSYRRPSDDTGPFEYRRRPRYDQYAGDRAQERYESYGPSRPLYSPYEERRRDDGIGYDRREDQSNRDEYGQFIAPRRERDDRNYDSGPWNMSGFRDRAADRDRNQYGEFTRARPTYGAYDDEDDDRGGYSDDRDGRPRRDEYGQRAPSSAGGGRSRSRSRR